MFATQELSNTNILLLHHHTSAIITDCNHNTTTASWLHLPNFDLALKQNKKPGCCRLDFNKLVFPDVAFVCTKFFHGILHYITLLATTKDFHSDLSLVLTSHGEDPLAIVPLKSVEEKSDDRTRKCGIDDYLAASSGGKIRQVVSDLLDGLQITQVKALNDLFGRSHVQPVVNDADNAPAIGARVGRTLDRVDEKITLKAIF